jgi:outer membrane protein assembly factor BamB
MKYKNGIVRILLAMLVCCLVVIPVSIYLVASDSGWSSFRGGCHHDGIADKPIEPPYSLYWKKNVGSRFINEVIEYDGLVYVCADSMKVFEADGDFYWEFSTKTSISTTPCVTGSIAVIGLERGDIIGIDINDHIESWRVATGASIAQGICEESGYCYVANSYGEIYKIDVLSGVIEFKITLDNPLSYGVIVLNDSLFAGDDKGNLYRIDKENSSLFWKKQIASSKIGSMLLYNDQLFFGSYDNNVYCIDSDDGSVIWTKRVDAWIDKTPVLLNEKIFVKIRESLIVALDLLTGKLLFKKEIQPSSSEMLVSGNTILVGSNRRLIAFTSDNEEVFHFEFVDEQISSISANNGYVYLGLTVGIDNIGRLASMKPSGLMVVRPKLIEKTIQTSDNSTSFQITISNEAEDEWQRDISVGLLTSVDWITIEEPIVSLKPGESREVMFTVNPFYKGIVGTNHATIKALQMPERPRHIQFNDNTSINENEENKLVIEIPLTITIKDPDAPKLCFDKSTVNIGVVSMESFKRVPFELQNCGGRDLMLQLEAISYPPWLNVSQTELIIRPGETEVIDIGSKGSMIKPEPGYSCDFRGALIIETQSGEEFTILCKTRCIGIPIPTTISIKVGSRDVMINGERVIFDPPSYISNGRTMVPLRLVAEAFFTSVDWNPSDRSIIIRDCDRKIQFHIGKNTVEITENNDVDIIKIDTSPEITNDRTFIPVRAVSEILGGEVSWDAPSQIVSINYNPK